ncbi:MAG: hypothetical protein E7290_07005 [Lachnospiraceae bacterium]|nr:hypothetical protein [Lachnospiraceae bacterium]
MIAVIIIFWAALFTAIFFLLSIFLRLLASILNAGMDIISIAVAAIVFSTAVYLGISWFADIVYYIVIGEFANKLGEFLVTILIISVVLGLVGFIIIAAASMIISVVVWIAGAVTAVIRGVAFCVEVLAHWSHCACNFFFGKVLQNVKVC